MHRTRTTLLTTALLGMSEIFILGSQLSAGVITFQASIEFSGNTSPVGTAPWLTTTFTDVSPGTVTMTLTATNLTGSEYVSQYIFNLDPSLDPTQLAFSAPTKVGSFDSPSIATGVNSFKADGDGYFDVKLDFATSDGLSTRFSSGDAISFTITGIPSLSAGSFNFLSQQGGDKGTYPDAAHVQSIGPSSLSGWLSVPEPATLSLLALGGIALPRGRKKR